MKCPACGNTLEIKTGQAVKLDVCTNGCAGIWFDNYELAKFDEPFEPADELLELEPQQGATVDPARRQCPKCDNITMLRHFFSVKHEVEVDECQSCGGIWLDHGELAAIRQLFSSTEQREQAAHEAFAEEFEQILADDWKKDQERLEKARRFAHALRFLCPSYYIPGKQKGGAF